MICYYTLSLSSRDAVFATASPKRHIVSQGMSLNALAVKTLRQTAGTVAMSGRKARVETTLRRYRVPDSEAAAAAQALARHDELDRAKERQDWEARGNSSF
jgi:uncharacterized protein YaiL (DUF2058 family)